MRGGRRRKEDTHKEGKSADANFNQNTDIATQPRVVVKVDGDEQWKNISNSIIRKEAKEAVGRRLNIVI